MRGLFFSLFFLFLASNNWLAAQRVLKLSDALNEATQSNPTLKAEKLTVPSSEADLAKSRLYQNPIFNLQYLQLFPSSMYYDRNHGMLNAVNSQDWYQLTKKFQVFGQRKNKISIAKLSVEASKSDLDETKRQIMYQVAMKWVDAWHSLAYKKLAEKAADYLDGYLKENFDSVKGVSRMKEDERLRFEILDDQYDLEKNRAEQNYFSVTEDLKILLGKNESFEIDLNDTSETIIIENSLDSLLKTAFEKRSDIKSLKTMKTISEENIRFQRSLSIPQPEGGFIWNPQNTIPYAGIFFTQTLPFFDRNQTEIQKAKIQAEMTSIELESNLTKLRTTMNVSFLDFKRKKEMVQKFRHNLDQSEQLLRHVRLSYLLNKYSIVDLWEAEQTWVQSYSLYYDTFADYRKSYITLLYEMNWLGRLD